MTHGSLFSGIGGFDLAAEWMGWKNVFHCEINKFCQKILKYYWPNAKSYEDIKSTDFTIWRGKIDVLSGGFPCQPYSVAGKRKGTEDDRHLWPQMLRAIREVQPCWIVAENVFGLVNWSRGLVFEQVQTDLESEGYEVTSYILPACGKNAPHQRYRLWIVANALQKHREESFGRDKLRETSKEILAGRNYQNVANAVIQRQSRPRKHRPRMYSKTDKNWEIGGIEYDDQFEAEWPKVAGQLCRMDDGLPERLDESERISALGNAIVPQIAFEIFKAIEQFENSIKE